MIDGAVALQENLRDGHEGIAILKEPFQNAGKSFRGVFGGVMEEDDGTGLDFGCDPLGDLRGGEVLPI